MNQLLEPPDAIIITISAEMLKEKGLRKWLRSFLETMSREDWTYWMRQGAKPKHSILWVYLCIGNKVRYRANFVMSEGPGEMKFSDGTKMFAKAWIVMAGPVVKAPGEFPMKGFRGFRYTQKLF